MELPLNDIPEEYRIIDACASIKTLGENGDIVVFHRFTEGLNDHEALGRCMAMTDILRGMITCNYMGSDEEDDEGTEED